MTTRGRGWTQALPFLAPWLFSLLIIWYGPIISNILMSFTRFRLVGSTTFVGMKNYIKIFQDPYFYLGLKNTFIFLVLFVPGMFIVSIFTAYMMSLDVRFKGFWRSIIYLPAVVPQIAVVILGKFIFYQNGLINTFLGFFGIDGPLWLADPALIKPAAVMLLLWQCGTGMVVYLGALRAVPQSYYEAADIDGLGTIRKFSSITLPLISSTIFFRVIVDTIFALMIFVPGLILPQGNVPGGPGNASRFYALHLYEKAFKRFTLGEASALATVLILISLILTVIVIRFSERFVYYEV